MSAILFEAITWSAKREGVAVKRESSPIVGGLGAANGAPMARASVQRERTDRAAAMRRA